jgi:CubicO group peptidase (beta-lactamase class C family)
MRINNRGILAFFLSTILLSVFPLSCGQRGSAKHIIQALSQENLPINHEDSIKNQVIAGYFQNQYRNGGFNGNVLIASHSKIIFEGCYGYSDYKAKQDLNPETAFQLASVTKQFTSMAILILQERGLVKLDDPVEKYIPGFPYQGITIRLLLGHRSGLSNYIYFCDEYIHDKETPVSNDLVVRMLKILKPKPYYEPDRTFNYSNTGYIILAYIVEKVSKMSFGEFLSKEIFEPLGMEHSAVVTRKEDIMPWMAVGYKGGWRQAPRTFLDGVVGDKGVYSSITDLYKWDRALYSDCLVPRSTLHEAFIPYGKPLNSKKNYGFGWRIDWLPDSTKVVYHTGWWEGFQTLLVRIEKDTSTVIVLKNRKSGHIDRLGILQLLYPDSFPESDGKMSDTEDEEQ